jgi:hypothetical protein
MGAFGFFKSMFSESDGTVSSTRVMVSLLITFVIAVGISFAIKVNAKGMSPEQFNEYLRAGSSFILTTCGPLYAVNKVASVMNNKTDKDDKQLPGVPGA